MIIDEVMWVLKDGKWHGLREVVEKCSQPKPQVERAVDFLWEFNFIQVDRKRGNAKLSPLMLKFIDEIQHLEKKEALSQRCACAS